MYSIKTDLIQFGDNLIDILLKTVPVDIEDGDVLVIAETVVATVEGRIVKLSDVKPSPKAIEYSKKYSLEPELAELIIQESQEILGGIPSLLLSIRDGMLLANAGIDHSNTPEGTVVLLPEDPMLSAQQIREEIQTKISKKIGVIIADSRTQPLRMGVVGVAVGVHSFEPIEDMRGKEDLFGRKLRVTRKAVADDLASAAEVLMSEANEGIPAVLIKNAPIRESEKKWKAVDLSISEDECLYMKIFSDWKNSNE